MSLDHGWHARTKPRLVNFQPISKERGMDTIASPADRLSHEQKSLTEAVRPSLRELVVARRRLHLKAAVIGALAVSSYWYIVASH